MRAVSQPGQSALPVTGNPPLHRLAGDTNRSATSVTGMSSRTSRTAWYLCSTTFNSRSIAGVSRIK